MARPANRLPLQAVLPPLRLDASGAARIGNSRVSLDTLVEQYENGLTVDELVNAHDGLELADVHAAIAYYLRHRDEVRAYMAERGAESRTLQGAAR